MKEFCKAFPILEMYVRKSMLIKLILYWKTACRIQLLTVLQVNVARPI